MRKNRVLIITLALFFIGVLILQTSALTASIGNGKIIENATVGSTIMKYILVKNPNNIPVNISLNSSGDLINSIKIIDEKFSLKPSEEKKAYFLIYIESPGTTESKINVKFQSENQTIALDSLIIINSKDLMVEKRISFLESFKGTISETLSILLTKVTELTNITTNHDTRIKFLETNSNITHINITYPNYFKYLRSQDRKNIVCGYAEDNHLTYLADLGWSCIITYKQSSRGERAYCSCKEK